MIMKCPHAGKTDNEDEVLCAIECTHFIPHEFEESKGKHVGCQPIASGVITKHEACCPDCVPMQDIFDEEDFEV